MKNKYMRLTKEEKRLAEKEYCESSEEKASLFKRLKRLRFIGVFGIIYASLSFILDILFTNNIWDYVLDAILLIFCLVFVLKANDMIINQVNKFIIDKQKKKFKEERKK